MKELPGDVFVTGQLLPAQMQALAEQGVMSFINNRPDMEGPIQPLSDDLEAAAQSIGVDYAHRFAHVDTLGVDDVMTAIEKTGFNLEQIRDPLTGRI